MLSADCINNGDIGITCSEDGVRADRHRNRHGHHRADDGSSGQGDRHLGHAELFQILPEIFGRMNKKAYLCTRY